MTKLGAMMSGGLPASALGPAQAPATETKLAARGKQIATGEYVEIAPYGRMWIEVLGHEAMNMIEGELFEYMPKVAKLPAIPLHAFSYDMNRYARVMAEAARDPDDPTHRTPYGTLSEWIRQTDDRLMRCRLTYMDVKERIAPMDLDAAPPDEICEQIVDAIKKKAGTSLRDFGVVTLASWLLTGGAQRLSSPTPASPSGEDPSD
jgi:hypothetical protein